MSDETNLPVIIPFLGEEEALAAAMTVKSGWVTQGPKVRDFEDRFASYTGAGYATAVANCTAALHLALLAAGVRPGDVVLTASHSFIATANSVRYVQAEPYFVDIDPLTLNISPTILEEVLALEFERREQGLYLKNAARFERPESPFHHLKNPTGRLGAILIVHQVGIPADMPAILGIAQVSGVPVVEDAACALGSEITLDGGHTWEKIGKPHGQVACFSFHPRKILTTGDGGMLTTNNPDNDRLFRLLRQHGMSVSDVSRHRARDIIFEDYVLTGFNYRMTDIQAAVGRAQLDRIAQMVERRRRLAGLYDELLAEIPEITVLKDPAYARSNRQSYVVFLDSPEMQLPVMRHLKDKGVSTRRGIMCAHLEPPYRNLWEAGGPLQESEKARDTGVILPLYHAMTEDDVRFVCGQVKEALKK